MRKSFANLLYQEMQTNDKIYVLTADLGYCLWDDIRRDFPERFQNVGSAEQLLIGAAVGLNYEGFIPVVYSITPFLLARPFEMLRNYVNHEKTAIKMCGSGRGREYEHDGITHWAEDDQAILNLLPNIVQYRPRDVEGLNYIFHDFLYSPDPAFISLSKKVVK